MAKPQKKPVKKTIASKPKAKFNPFGLLSKKKTSAAATKPAPPKPKAAAKKPAPATHAPAKTAAHKKSVAEKPAAAKAAPAKKPAAAAQKPARKQLIIRKPLPTKTSKPRTAPATVSSAPPPPPLRPPTDSAPVPPAVAAELAKTIGRRRFCVESPIRKPTPPAKLIPQATWDEVIFSIVSNTGKTGILVEDLCSKAIAVKYDKRDVRAGAVTPYTRFHNSNITNLEAVCRYLDSPEFRAVYGYREMKR